MNKKTESMPILRTVKNDVEVLHYNDEEKNECLNKYHTSISTVDESSSSLPNYVIR